MRLNKPCVFACSQSLRSPFFWLNPFTPRVSYGDIKALLTFETVDEILKCNQSNESCWAVLFCGAVYYAVQGGSNFWVLGWNPKVWPFKWKLLSSIFLWCCLLCCTCLLCIMYYAYYALTFESVDEILKCDHSNEAS